MRQNAYLHPMKFLKTDQPDDHGPRDHLSAIADFWDYLRQDRPHRWASMGLAITIPLVIIYGMYKSLIQPEPPPSIIYVESWPADRSRADVERDWKARAEKMNEDNAKRRAAYRSVADALGIDYTPAPGTEGGPPIEGQAKPAQAAPPNDALSKDSSTKTSPGQPNKTQ